MAAGPVQGLQLSGPTSAHVVHSPLPEVCALFPTPPKPSLPSRPCSQIASQKMYYTASCQTSRQDTGARSSSPSPQSLLQEARSRCKVRGRGIPRRCKYACAFPPRQPQPEPALPSVPQFYVCLRQKRRAGTQRRLWIGQREGTVQVPSPTIGRGRRASDLKQGSALCSAGVDVWTAFSL